MLSNLSPIVPQRQKLSDHVYDALCEAIIQGELKPGERLREAQVAEALGVSRTPVREAFGALERQHLMVQDASGAYFVAQWDERILWEVATLRAALECLAINLASENFTPEDLDSLQSIITQMDGAIEREDFERLSPLDIEFHSYIWSRTGHMLLQDALEQMKSQIRYFVHLTPPEDNTTYAGYHRDIVQALKGGDPGEEQQTMRDHILYSAKGAIARLEHV